MDIIRYNNIYGPDGQLANLSADMEITIIKNISHVNRPNKEQNPGNHNSSDAILQYLSAYFKCGILTFGSQSN